MKIEYKKKFLKQLSKIPSAYRNKIEEFVFEKLNGNDFFDSFGKIEKMTGYKNYYKIRFGSYRVGLKLENDKIIF